MDRNEEKQLIRKYAFPCMAGKVQVTEDFFGLSSKDTISVLYRLKKTLLPEHYIVYDGLHNEYLEQLRNAYYGSNLTSEQRESSHLFDFNLYPYASKRGLVKELKQLK